jgi:CHAT domain-containing protein/tetratricopeptide (TPR) repeat protein
LAVTDDALVEMSARCSRSGASLQFEAVAFVSLPTDAPRLIDLLAGTLNDFACPICPESIRLRPMLGVYHAAAAELLVACASPSEERELRDTADEEGYEVIVFADYEALRQAVAARANSYLREAIASVLAQSPSAPTDRPRPGRRPPHSPFVLLLLHAMSEGLLPVRLELEQEMSVDEQRAWRVEVAAAATADSVDRLFTDAFHHGGPHTVLDRISAEIPVECLTDRTLTLLLERCVEWDAGLLTDPSALDRAWRYEYLAAAAHAVAGVANPRGMQWANAHLTLFMLSRSPRFVVSDEMLLDAAVLSKTIRFADAWKVTHAGHRVDEPVPDDIPAWYEFIGLAEDYGAELWAAPIQVEFGADTDDTAAAANLLQAFVDTMANGEPEGVGSTAAMLCKTVFRAGRHELAQQLAESILEHLAAGDNWAGVGWALRYLAQMFCDVFAYQVADQLLANYALALFGTDHELPCRLRYVLLNEIGNVHRYRRRPRRSLETYDEAAAVMADCPGVTESHRRILVRNQALALRDDGRIDEAVEMLTEVLEQTSLNSAEAVEVRQNIARTYGETGLWQDALIHLRAAQEVPLSVAHVEQRVLLLVNMAAVRTAAENEPELPELGEAMAAAGTGHHLRCVVANAVLDCAQRATVAPEVIAEAESVAHDFLTSPQDEIDWMYLSLLTSLAGWWFHQGRTEEAQELFGNFAEWGLEGYQLPWQTLWLMARMAGPDALSEQAFTLWLALKRLEEDVPHDVGPSYAASWLGDKGPFQAFLTTTVQQAIAGTTMPADVGIEVCEFVNGREVRPRDAGDVTDDPWQVFSRVVPPERPAVAVAFLESDIAIDLIVVASSGTEPTVVRLPTPTDRVRAVQAVFDRNIGGTALLPSQHRKAADAVAEILAQVGTLLKGCVQPGVHICLLPSASVLGLPLHAASADGRLLLEDHPISYGPNLAMVCDLLARGPAPSPAAAAAGVIVVPKDGDRPEYIDRGDQAAARLTQALGADGNPVVQLRHTEADKAACLNAFSSLEYLVLLVHGAQSRRLHGRGLCVSDGVVLPRAPLPVDSVPQLRRFVIDAGDLAALGKTPSTLMSLACSSGQTLAGAGGSRIGLDRALLPNGTRTIVAPLWDVNQQSALQTLEEFQGRWIEQQGLGPAEHLRRAQLAARERNDSLYHWAPLVLKGSWL